jgi:hypothetical protein
MIPAERRAVASREKRRRPEGVEQRDLTVGPPAIRVLIRLGEKKT